MKYQVKLYKSEEGYAISCPLLPGCWSQGETEEEALENIKDAISVYLETVEELNIIPRNNPINAYTIQINRN